MSPRTSALANSNSNTARSGVPTSASVPIAGSHVGTDLLFARFAKSASVDGGVSSGALRQEFSFESATPKFATSNMVNSSSVSDFVSPTASRRLAVRLLVGGVDMLPPSPAHSAAAVSAAELPPSPSQKPSPKLPPRRAQAAEGTDSSPRQQTSPFPTSSPTDGGREERREERRRLRKASQSERPERPSRQSSPLKQSQSERPERPSRCSLHSQQEQQQQKGILKTSPRDGAWEVCDELSRMNNVSPTSSLTASSRPSKSKHTNGSIRSSIAAEALAASLEVTSAAAAAAEAARDGQWLASGFEELQKKLESFSRTTHELAVSLEEARKDARKSRAAMAAAQEERDLLVSEMGATLAAWSASDAEKEEQMGRLEVEKAQAEIEKLNLKRELAEMRRQNVAIKRQLEGMRAERDAAVTHARVTVAKAAAAAAAAAAGAAACEPASPSSSHLPPRPRFFTPLLAHHQDDDTASTISSSSSSSSVSPRNAGNTGGNTCGNTAGKPRGARSSNSKARDASSPPARSAASPRATRAESPHSCRGSCRSSCSLSDLLEGEVRSEEGGASNGGLKKAHRSHDALPAYGDVVEVGSQQVRAEGRMVAQKHVQWAEQCC